ncbi:universal stress protein [Pseudonocardia sp. CA-107938]|uniref:universal stress protein n=1 Tax=Pseudonocardia sp. CA-107938 TaxID=3240021 RepID=UPI003D904CFF
MTGEVFGEVFGDVFDDTDDTGALGIVVGVDGSAAASRAVGWATAEAHVRGLPLSILHAAPYVLGAAAGRERAGEVLAAAAALARRRAPGLRITTWCAPEPPVAALGSAAARARLLVLGGADRPNAEPTESIGLRVLESAPCPVVVVQGRTRAAVDDLPVVAGIDSPDPGAPLVGAILAAAAEAARRRRCSLVVLHAGTAGAPTHDLAHELADHHPDLEVHPRVSPGHPTTALLDAARGARLLVIGSRGRSAPVRVRLGSTCRDVLRRSSAPVEVVPGDHLTGTVPDFSPSTNDQTRLW